MHPTVMNFLRIGTDGDVFSHHGVFCASLGSTLIQGRLARKLMRERIFARHELGVLARGGGEGIIPFKRMQSSRRTFAVSGIEQEFFVSRGMRRERRSPNRRTILRVVLRMGGAKKGKKTECGPRAGGSKKTRSFHGALAAHVHSVEVENHVAAGSGPAKTQHRAETREEKNFVELMAQGRARGTGKNFVVHHLAA